MWKAQSFKCMPSYRLKLGESLDQDVSQCFVSLVALQTFYVTFQAKNNVISAPASTSLAQVLQ